MMRRRLGWTVIALALLVAGCQYYWTKPGATDEQFYRDSYECAAQASQQFKSENLYRACLLARGYQRGEHVVRPASSWRGVNE